MVLISRTGLQESDRRPTRKSSFTTEDCLGQGTSLAHMMPPIAVPAPFAHRPLAGLPNPFRRSGGACSILCNHPAPPSAVQGLLHAAKLKGDGLRMGTEDDDDEEAVVPEELFRRYTETDSRPMTPALSSSASDTQLATRSGAPDSLFCVSSPPSLSATTNSPKRRQGQGFLSRRSQTPDPPYRPQPPQRQKTMLVLDLRRSQSQDDGLWQAQQTRGGQSGSPASSESPKNAPKISKHTKIPLQGTRRPQLQHQQAVTKQTQKQGEVNAAAATPDAPTAAVKKKVGQQKTEKKGGKGDATGTGGEGTEGAEVGTMVMPPTPREEDLDDRQTPPLERKGARKRPHKKKKKSIGGGGLEAGALSAGRGETPEKEFRGMPEPRETQVSTLAGDGMSSMSLRGPSRATPEDALYAYDARDGKLSTLPHTRPSTSQTRASPAVPYSTLEAILGREDFNDWDEEKSFLDPLLLRHLERELDRETVETEFRPLRKRALMEALKSKWQKLHHHSRKKEKMANMGGAHQSYGLDTRGWSLEPTNLWLNLPRTFSRQSARFELPFDSRKFKIMSPLQYVQEYVIISSGRRLLYNRVFNRHRKKDKQDAEPGDDDDLCYPEQRSMPISVLPAALSEVMGKELTGSQANYFIKMFVPSGKGRPASSRSSAKTDPRDEDMDFRTFSGIAAVCERLIGGGADLSEDKSEPQQIAHLPTRSLDPPHEIETVDFEKLTCRLRSMPEVDNQLAEMLLFIKEL